MLNKIIITFLAITCICPALSQAKDQSEPTPISISSGGVPQTEKTVDILPKGAIAHIQANNLKKLIFDVEALGLSLLPEKMVPPPMQPLLQDKHPLLAFVGSTLNIPNFNMALLSQMTGIDFNKEVTFSIYFEDQPTFIASLPVSKIELISDTLVKTLQIEGCVNQNYGDYKGFNIQCRNNDLPRNMHVVCSDNRAYISNSTSLLAQLGKDGGNNLSDNAAIKKALATYSNSDLIAILDNEYAKNELNKMTAPFAKLPPQQIDQFKNKIIKEFKNNEDLYDMITMCLRFDLNINGIDELMDYAECYLIPAYEILFTELHQKTMAFEGLAIALDINKDFQKLHLSAYSNTIEASTGTKPLPMSEVKKALNTLPSNRNWTHIIGQKSPAEKSKLCTQWLAEVEKYLDKKTLDKKMFLAIKSFITGHKAVDPLESRSSWTIKTQVNEENYFDSKNVDTFTDYLYGISEKIFSPASFDLTLSSASESDFATFLNDKKDQLNTNYNSYNDLMLLISKQNSSWITKKVSLNSSPLKDGIKRWTLDESYLSRSGIFGYDQHEFINRDIYYTGKLGDYLAIEKTNRSTPYLMGKKEGVQTSKAMNTLLSLVPEGSHDIFVLDNRSFVLSLTDFLKTSEDIIHKELNNYLKKIISVESKTKEELKKVEMPLYVSSLNQNKNTGEYYCVLLNQITFPRPKAQLVIDGLLADYRRKDAELGGTVCYQKQGKGQYEYAFIQSTEALAYLIKSSINTFHSSYLSEPDGQQKLMMSVMSEMDRNPNRNEEAIITNPFFK